MAETLRELVVALSLEKAISRVICAPSTRRSRKPSPPSVWPGLVYRTTKKTIAGTEAKLSIITVTIDV